MIGRQWSKGNRAEAARGERGALVFYPWPFVGRKPVAAAASNGRRQAGNGRVHAAFTLEELGQFIQYPTPLSVDMID